jgi:hypothetical protein
MPDSEGVRHWIEDVRREPRAWLWEADRLKRAADLVGSRFQGEANEWARLALSDETDDAGRDSAFELGFPSFMLIGYAIEVLAKGLIVAANASDETIDRVMRTHIDVPLLREAAVTLEAGDAFLVEQTLYHAVRWSGRYPVPGQKVGERYAKQVAAAQGSIFSHPGAISTDHYRRACDLFDRMRGQLVALVDAIKP